MDDDSDRASEVSSGSRSRKSNGKSKGKNKSSKKKIDLADEDSDTSQASGKNKRKAGKSKGKREKIVINKKGNKERKKKAGELLSLSAIAFKCFVTNSFNDVSVLYESANQKVSWCQLLFF